MGGSNGLHPLPPPSDELDALTANRNGIPLSDDVSEGQKVSANKGMQMG